MIRIIVKEPPNQNWLDKARVALDELIQAREEKKKVIFKAKIYGDSRHIRPLIRRTFHGKCAYCESDIPRQDGDIEHFRPKGRVSEVKHHPGYWWLAYDFDNLLLSCRLCNQFRKRPDGRIQGKGDSFPLINEEMRAFKPLDKIANENPVLLNPRTDSPEEHLIFDFLGNINPKNNSLKGKGSIHTFSLDHPWLIEARLKYYNKVLKPVALLWLNKPENEDILKLIEELIADDAQYSQLAKQVFTNPDQFGLS